MLKNNIYYLNVFLLGGIYDFLPSFFALLDFYFIGRNLAISSSSKLSSDGSLSEPPSPSSPVSSLLPEVSNY
jgi:hypothetical protein